MDFTQRVAVITAAEPATTATTTSAEINLLALLGQTLRLYSVDLYVSVAGFASAPTGNMQTTYQPVMHLTAGLEQTGGTVFADAETAQSQTVSADTAYTWRIRVASPVPVFKVAVKNNTNVNTDTDALNVWAVVSGSLDG